MSLRVLVVEDDKYLNKLITDRLKLEGLRVESVLDGLSAKTLLDDSNQSFDVLLVDILLPRLSGFDLLEQINHFSRHSSLRKIAMSGIHTERSKVKEITDLYKLESFWTKPFELDALLAAITGQEITTLQKMSLSGELYRRPIETLFLEAYDHAFTGRLKVKNGDLEKTVYFTNGFPVSAESNAMSESLGRSLVSLGVISDDVREEASRQMVAEKVFFGQMLVKMGALNKNELFQGLRKHSYRLLLTTLQLRQGSFEFEALEKLPDYVIRIEFNPVLLMLKAQANQVHEEALRSIFQTKNSSYLLKSDRYAQILTLFNLKPETFEFLKQVRSDLPFEKIMEPIPEKNRASAYRIFYLMESLGLIQWIMEPADLEIETNVLETDFPEAFASEHQLPAEAQERLKEDYVDFINKNYFEILDISEEASPEEVRDAYEKRRAEYQPKNFGPLSGESKRILDDILSRIDQAHQLLSDPEKRKDYEALVNKVRQDSALNSKRFLEAQDNFHEGNLLLKKSKFQEAQALFEKAHDAWPQNFEYNLYAKYAQFRSHLEKKTGSENLLIQDIRDIVYANASSDIAFLILGYSYQATGRKEQARESFQKALRNNENCEEASNALMALVGADSKGADIKESALWFYRLVKPILGVVFLSGVLFALYHYRDAIWYQEEGIKTLSPDLFKPEIPSIQVRLKNESAKVSVQKDWINNVPDSVFKTKCLQALGSLDSYGIRIVYFFDQEEGLKAICREEKLTRF